METDLVQAAGYGPPGGSGYGPPGGGGPPMGGPPGYGGPPGGGPPMGGPPGYGPPPGGYGPPPGGGFGPPPGGFGGPPGGPMMMGGGPRLNPLALTSMILGIASIPSCCCWFLGAPMAVASLVLGIISMGKIKNEPQNWKGVAWPSPGSSAAPSGSFWPSRPSSRPSTTSCVRVTAASETRHVALQVSRSPMNVREFRR